MAVNSHGGCRKPRPSNDTGVKVPPRRSRREVPDNAARQGLLAELSESAQGSGHRGLLDRVVPDVQIHRLQGMFAAAGWQVITLKWGRTISALFEQPRGDELRRRLEDMANEEYQRLLRVDTAEVDTIDSFLVEPEVPYATTPRESIEEQVRAMADSVDEIFGPNAAPDELRAFYEAIGLSMEYDCNSREISVEIALEIATPTSKNEVGVAHGVRGETRSLSSVIAFP